MSTKPRILAMAGSTRQDSYNKRLARIAALGAEAAGAEVTVIDLRDFPLPLFDEDLERVEGPPEAATKLKGLMVEHDGLIVASPEYNSSVTAVLKNAIDWASRPAPGEPQLVAFRGKVASLLSASPGALGGLRGLVHLRSILGNIGVVVLPDQIAVPRAFEAFSEDGSLIDPERQAAVEGLGRALVGFVARLKA
jgi:chromate reductase